jgi:beta-galactosidase
MSGANWDNETYEPDVTSYDYDAAVSESGALTKKYFAFRDVIAKHRPAVAIPDPPAPLPVIEVPEFEVEKVAGLWDIGDRPLGEQPPRSVEQPRNMEAFGQSYGYILYQTRLKSAASGELVLPELRSYARIYVNWKLVGVVDRRKNQGRIELHAKADDDLSILVEATGRINYGDKLRSERQGINGPVTLAGRELRGWNVWRLPMDDLSHVGFTGMEPSKGLVGPAFYQGHFELQTTGDTFLDMRGWGKGAVWINGHALGRFWNLGPQQTLYLPAPWLKKGTNEVIVFTLGGHNVRLRGLRAPILDELGSE